MSYRDARYKTHMRSKTWRNKRLLAIRRAHYRCEKCGMNAFSTVTGAGLDVHHKNYDRFGGQELPSDLLVVCRRCHKGEDRKDSWDRRVVAWATKIWGEDWEEQHDFEYMEQRFQSWLSRRGEE